MSTVTRAIIRKCNLTQYNRNGLQTSNSIVTVDKSNFYNNSYRYAGNGAIYASYSKISIKDSRFNDNGGNAVYASNSNISIKDFHFNDNGGIAIDVSHSNISIKDSHFNDNDVNAISAQYSIVKVDRAEFNYNDGSAISMYRFSELQVNNSTFHGNRARRGGAIYMYSERTFSWSPIRINNTAFHFNTAQYQGGAIYLRYGYSSWRNYYKHILLQLHNTTFHSNTAHYSSGGAVYINIQSDVNNGWWSITESQFINNIASLGNGGAVLLYETRRKTSHTLPSVITKCQFINSIARNASGGAIYKNGKNTELMIDKNSYVNNTANAFGGAI